ncbi:hypothetical protein U3516DRAFT_737226 [Neocallimastix sp. 'constans']
MNKNFLRIIEIIKKENYNISNININITEAYRYLISAKVLNKLNEFKILPNKYHKQYQVLTKTEEQIKLLWKTFLRKVRNFL